MPGPIMCLVKTGNLMEAQRRFSQAHPLYDRFSDGYTQNRLAWLTGLMARGLGQIQEAEVHLNSTLSHSGTY